MTAPLNEHGTGHDWPWREVDRLQLRIDGSLAELDGAIYQLELLAMAVKASATSAKVKLIIKQVRAARLKLLSDVKTPR